METICRRGRNPNAVRRSEGLAEEIDARFADLAPRLGPLGKARQVLKNRYPRAVLDEAFFLTVAGLAMSFAGFAGLMNALRRRGETWEPMELYQLRTIVAYAITTLFGSLLVVRL